MITTNHKTLEHPRILFYLGFFGYIIGITCGTLSNSLMGIELAIVFPLILILSGGWKEWYIPIFTVIVSLVGCYMSQEAMTIRQASYDTLVEQTANFSGTYTIVWTVEKLLYTSNLTSTYRLNIDNIANRSTNKNVTLVSNSVGIFLEIPNNLHISEWDTIEFTSKLSSIINWSLEWFSGYAWYHEIYGKSAVSLFKRIKIAPLDPLKKIQVWAKSVLFAGFPENIAGILLGMTIWNIELLTSETKQAFMNAGITHILVVSGSNIAFVIVILTWILRYIPIHRSIRISIIITFVSIYWCLVGWDMPVIRAVAMGIITYLAIEWWKKASSIAILFLICIWILLYSPLSLIYDAGFGLSFAATLWILLFHEPIASKINCKFLPKFFIDIISVTLSASIGSIPAILYHFHTIPLYSLVSNILISGFLGWILFATVLYLVFAMIGWWILYIWGWLIYIPTAYILWIGRYFWDGSIFIIDSEIAKSLALLILGLMISWIFYTEKMRLLKSK